MEKKYVVVGEDNSVSQPMTRNEAVNKVQDLSHEGTSYYIVSEEEGRRIQKKGVFNKPKWE